MSWVESVSGYAGGALGIFSTHPLDTVRIRAQYLAQQGHIELSYAGIVKDILKTSGPLGFYRGVLPPVLLRGFTMGVNRFSYDFADQHYNTKNRFLRSWWVGFFAGGMTAIPENPIHLIKTRVQTIASDDFKETIGAYVRLGAQLVREEGFRSLMSGIAPNMLLMSCSFGVFYVAYDEMKYQKIPTVVSGMTAAVLSWPVFYPLEVVRTRLQATPMKTRWSQEYFTFFRSFSELTKGPFTKWFPGLGLTLVRTVPRWGIVMTVHDHTRTALTKLNERH